VDITELAWGVIVLGAGVFLSVYGLALFRFALLAMGFAAGTVGAWWLLDDQDSAIRFLVSIIAGAIVGGAFYSLVKFGVYIAGAMIGVVVAILVGGIIDILGPRLSNPVMTILVLGGVVGGGLFGHRLGRFTVLLATSATGALLVIEGLRVLYASRIGDDTGDPTIALAQRLTLTIFVVVFAISVLSQDASQRLRQRLVR
jgi:hypothetical protein